MNRPSQAPQTGPGPRPRAPSSSGRGRGWETAFCAHVVHAVPPYVLTPGRPPHPHVRLAGQAPSPFDGPTVLPIKTRSEPGLGFRLLLLLPRAAPALVRGGGAERNTPVPRNHQRSDALLLPRPVGTVPLPEASFLQSPLERTERTQSTARESRNTLLLRRRQRRSQNASLHSRGWKSHTWGPPRR